MTKNDLFLTLFRMNSPLMLRFQRLPPICEMNRSLTEVPEMLVYHTDRELGFIYYPSCSNWLIKSFDLGNS